MIHRFLTLVSFTLCSLICVSCSSDQVSLPTQMGADFLNALKENEEKAVRNLLITKDECLQWANSFFDKKQVKIVPLCERGIKKAIARLPKEYGRLMKQAKEVGIDWNDVKAGDLFAWELKGLSKGVICEELIISFTFHGATYYLEIKGGVFHQGSWKLLQADFRLIDKPDP